MDVLFLQSRNFNIPTSVFAAAVIKVDTFLYNCGFSIGSYRTGLLKIGQELTD